MLHLRSMSVLAGLASAVAVSSCGSRMGGSFDLTGEPTAGVAECGLSIPSTGTVPEGCIRTEGAQLGKLTTLALPGTGISVMFTDWRLKEGEGEYVGFTVVVSGGSIAYAVKTGGETHFGTTSTWVHPKGVAGPEAKAISNITFCPASPDGGMPPGSTPDSPTPPGGCDGSPQGPGLPPGAPCTAPAQCRSGSCVGGLCEVGYTGAPCGVGTDCASAVCTANLCEAGGAGAPCTAAAHCLSGVCTSTSTSTSTGSGAGAGTCDVGGAGQRCRVPADCSSARCVEGACPGSIG